MAWFYRIIELGDGSGWACCFGSRRYDVHPELAGAVEHMKRIAADDQASMLFVHRLDGTVDAMGPD